MHRGFTKPFFGFLDALVALLSRSGLSPDFIRFGMVGVSGFLGYGDGIWVEIRGRVVRCRHQQLGINRLWTFRHLDHITAHHQLARFLLANLIGFIFNLGPFFTLISISPLCHSQPVLAIIAGSAAGSSECLT